MASLPTTSEIRSELEGYNITPQVVSDAWLERNLSTKVVPQWEESTRSSVSGEIEVTEYLSGNGYDLLMLGSRQATEIVSISQIGSSDIDNSIDNSTVILIPGTGQLRRSFGDTNLGSNINWPKGKKNIKVVYKVGGVSIPDDVKWALASWVAINALKLVSSRTGGGSLGVEGFSRDYGKVGKYSNIISQMWGDVYRTMQKYMTGVGQT